MFQYSDLEEISITRYISTLVSHKYRDLWSDVTDQNNGWLTDETVTTSTLNINLKNKIRMHMTANASRAPMIVKR